MIDKNHFQADQPTQPVPAISIKRETSEERFQRLKQTADATGKRFVQVYLADERRFKGHQR